MLRYLTLAAIWIVAMESSPRAKSDAVPFASQSSQPLSPFFARADYQELLRQFQQPPTSR